jgi:N-methylhydantoinase B/oxoprolinase/acetone carboxylase alpha subunit
MVTLSIIHNHLVNICREMGIAMMRTAYSTMFNEGLDFSCVIFNRKGEMIAQAEFCPAQLGAIQFMVGWTIEELGVDSFEPGDVVIHNDPYRGGCHMPEHTVLMPVFFEERLWGFVANIGHVSEIGGMAPGSFAATSTEVYQEGLRLPPVKIMRRGEYVKDIWRIILANHRTPDNSWGDFHAMIGSLKLAERRLHKLLEKHGAEFVDRATQELMDHAERWMREEIRRIPDGEYTFEDCMEDDGVMQTPTFVRVTLIVKGDEILADYTRSDPQARGCINATYGVTASATYNAIFHIVDNEIPHNAGCYRPIQIIAPPGSCVNVRHPGPSVAGNTETHPRIVDLVLGALSKAIPERVAAAEGGTSCNFLFGGFHPETCHYYVDYHFEAGGWGGSSFKDGNNAVVVPNGNCRNTPVEIFETRFPYLTLAYGLVPDSGGPGKFRGGLGIRRLLRVTAPEITLSALFERMKVKPWGLFGGMEASASVLMIRRRGDASFRTFQEVFGTVSPAKFVNITIRAGDEIWLQSPGGGGFGNPVERPTDAVLRDVSEGFVTPEAARRHYRTAVRKVSGEYVLDLEETAHLRGEGR